MAKNVRDAGRVLLGLEESYRLLRRLKPDVVFVKGGFVGVPVGLAAARLGIPLITHDSDVIPGLANRIIARWVSVHAVAMPKELYSYPANKTVTVGIPVSSDYQKVTKKLMQTYRQEVKLESFEQVLLVTGGGNGAQSLNLAVAKAAPELLGRYPKLAIVHFSGRAHESETAAAYARYLSPEALDRIKVMGFATDFYRYSGAADIILARGSATNLAEFAIQQKACIIVPANQLVWTVRNAEMLEREGAIVVLGEGELRAQPAKLTKLCEEILEHPQKATDLAEKLAQFAHPNAARELAELLLRKGQR